MDKKEIQIGSDASFFKNVSSVIEQARKNAKTAVNLSMVYAYFEIGKMIVEREQGGSDRAEYGKKLLQELSNYLTKLYGKGYSADNLKLMRRFYVVYSHDQIGETLFPQSKNLPVVSTGRKFYLSWSHYLKLMRMDKEKEPQPTPSRAPTEALHFWLKIDLYPCIFGLEDADGKTYGAPFQRRL